LLVGRILDLEEGRWASGRLWRKRELQIGGLEGLTKHSNLVTLKSYKERYIETLLIK